MQNNFLQKVKTIYSEADFEVVKYAFEFASEAHKDQKRVSGEPYIIHPIAVSEILMDLGMDAITIAAALLHDVIEDTGITVEDFERRFGEEITLLVKGVTKLSKLKFDSLEEVQAENYRKMFFAMAKDIRVLFIKLADRLHNMRTLEYMKPEKQQRIAKETFDLYAPLAGRLGIASIKSELEDLSMKYLYPEEYNTIRDSLNKMMGERMGFVMRIASEIEVQLSEMNINGEVKGRPKHIYSIYKKMKSQNKTLEQIYDLIAVRVIVENVRECYSVLGVIHTMWKPMPGRFKDYIAMPKPNFYQSLHTTVVTNFGQIFEIQIRTYEMNRIAEYGIAAHWKYKEGKTEEKISEFDQKLGWIQEAMDAEKDIKNSEEFLNILKMDILSHEIYVFTPKGSVFNLPKNSTCIDFAYRIHTEVGNKCVGAKVNNKIEHLDHVLNTGDLVEILTSPQSKGPSRDWLNYAHTSQAITKIKAFFKKSLLTENIKTGKDMLEKEAKHRGYTLGELLTTQGIEDRLITKFNLSSLDDLYASIGYGGITTNKILIKLVDAYKKEQALKNKDKEIDIDAINKNTNQYHHNHSGVVVEGFDDFVIKISKCCNPLPGDDIIGYATRGTGVSVHRVDCTNIKAMEPERIMKAKWINGEDNSFVAILRVECENKDGVLNQIVNTISSNNISITMVDARSKNKGDAVIIVGIQVKSTDELNFVTSKLKEIPPVLSVGRNN